jgi:hypothetical protein
VPWSVTTILPADAEIDLAGPAKLPTRLANTLRGRLGLLIMSPLLCRQSRNGAWLSYSG